MAVVKKISDIAPVKVEADGAVNTTKRLLLGSGDGVPHFSARYFEVGPGGRTPSHRHDFEHEIIVLDGTGELITADTRIPIGSGAAVFISPMEQHHLENRGSGNLTILCMVPKEYE